jgi:predicted esterase
MTTEPPFEETLREINADFHQGEYTAVLKKAAQAIHSYPDQKPILYYLQICAAARLDQEQDVYSLLNTAHQDGVWYSEWALRETPSLKALVGRPEFEHLIEVSAQLAAAESSSEKTTLVASPPSGSGPFPLLIALHSNASSAEEAVKHWQTLTNSGIMVALPQSRRAAWKGNYSWQGDDEELNQIVRAAQNLSQDYQIDPERVILAGHSMGGSIAIRLTLSQEIRSRGFVVVGPYLTAENLEDWRELLSSAPKSLRGAILIGEDDDTILLNPIDELINDLQRRDIDVWRQQFPDTGHEFNPAIKSALLAAVQYVLGSE